MIVYGLIGRSLSHSYSQSYFLNFFRSTNKHDSIYINFELKSIAAFKNIIRNIPELAGLNVTIPYKEEIMPFLDEIDPVADQIGAVNTIQIKRTNGIRLKGYNTDYLGVRHSLSKCLTGHEGEAWILGTGGASKAVSYALEQMQIKFKTISSSGNGNLSYADLDRVSTDIIVNTTPLGTFPNINQCPELPYGTLTGKEILFDLVYNPAQTLFMKQGLAAGCMVLNGEEMLKIQAQEAWKLWQES